MDVRPPNEAQPNLLPTVIPPPNAQVDRLHLKLHPLVYRNKTYSAREFGLRLRKDVVKDLLSQVSGWGSLLDTIVGEPATHVSPGLLPFVVELVGCCSLGWSLASWYDNQTHGTFWLE